MSASPEKMFDRGQEVVPITFRVKTSHLKQGESVSMHMNKDHLLQVSGVPHADALNVKSVDIKAHSTCGLVGISLTNTSSVTGPDAKFVDAVDTHTLADSSTSAADVFHAVTGLSFTDSQRVNLKPDEAQLDTNKILTQKRFNPQWLSMDERNVSKGVVKSTLGDQTRYLITEKCPKTGESSAIHTLMSQNLENPNFFKGKYSTKGKFKPTTVSGLPALVLEAGDYEQIKTQLTKSLTTKSNFQHGVGVRITKLSNDKADGDYSCVQLKLNRTPMHPEEGLIASVEPGVSMTKLSELNGAVSGTKPVNTKSGFEDTLKGAENEAQPELSFVDESLAGADV